MSELYIWNDILKSLEGEIRYFHSKIIKGIAQNIMNDPDKIPEMYHKYMKWHPRSNMNETMRPPRVYKNLTEEEEIKEFETTELTKYLEENDQSSDNQSSDNQSSDNDDDRCQNLVHYKNKIRQCHKNVLDDSEYCGIHDGKIVYPFGTMKNKDKKIDND